MYLLSDMTSVGCHFVMQQIVRKGHSKMIVLGDLFVGNREYKGKAVVYSDSRPARLLDVVDENGRASVKDREEVKSFMQYHFHQDTNGVCSRARSGFIVKFLWAIALTASAVSAVWSITNALLYRKQEACVIAFLFVFILILCIVRRPTRRDIDPAE